jgi:hypothetical protein
MQLRQTPAERQIVLVDEEPCGHGNYAASERSCSS